MYRFLLRPSWVLLHVTVVATIVLMINLGIWQLSRYHERMDFNEIVSARIEAQPQNLNELLLEIETGTKQNNQATQTKVLNFELPRQKGCEPAKIRPQNGRS